MKFLFLHGGGGSPAGDRGLMQGITSALGAGHTFVYATAPYAGGLWIRSPPGGKGQPTTDANWAADSFSLIDSHVQNDGPFDALMGFSQGAAMAVLYVSQSASSFQFAVTFCGYVPTTHSGLASRITSAAPMNIPALFYMGTADAIISNAMTREAASQFATPTFVSDGGGHAPPQSGSAVTEVVAFVNGFASGSNRPPSLRLPAAASPPPPTPADSVGLIVGLSAGGGVLMLIACFLARRRLFKTGPGASSRRNFA